MVKTFGYLADGGEAKLYTIENGRLLAQVTDYGASLVTLRVDGTDVCLGCDDVSGYERNGAEAADDEITLLLRYKGDLRL